MTRYAILVIDMLYDFFYGSLKCERLHRIIPNVKQALERARDFRIPIIYVNDAHLPYIDRELKLWGQHAIRNTKGAQVIEEVKPLPGDYIITKRRYSAFFETELDLLLRELDIDVVVLMGVHTHVCILHTAADAFFRGYGVIVLSDCVEAATEEEHQWALNYMKKYYGVKIMTSEEFFDMVYTERCA